MGQATGVEPPLRCSFCNKPQSEVRKLIAGPNAFICDECVQVCREIIVNDADLRSSAASSSAIEAPAMPVGGEVEAVSAKLRESE